MTIVKNYFYICNMRKFLLSIMLCICSFGVKAQLSGIIAAIDTFIKYKPVPVPIATLNALNWQAQAYGLIDSTSYTDSVNLADSILTRVARADSNTGDGYITFPYAIAHFTPSAPLGLTGTTFIDSFTNHKIGVYGPHGTATDTTQLVSDGFQYLNGLGGLRLIINPSVAGGTYVINGPGTSVISDDSLGGSGSNLFVNPNQAKDTAAALRLLIAAILPGSTTYAALTDVSLTSLSNGQLMKYNSGTGKWNNFTPTYISSYTETDPVYSASAAAGVTSTTISHWNTAYNKYTASASYSGSTLTLTANDASTVTATIPNGTVTSVTAGTGLAGGTITTSGTISMPNVGTAATYGDATHVATITTDAQGRASAATSTAITFPSTSSKDLHSSGNTDGKTDTVGVLDNNGLNIVTNGTAKITVANTGAIATANSTLESVVTVKNNQTGSVVTGVGVGVVLSANLPFIGFLASGVLSSSTPLISMPGGAFSFNNVSKLIVSNSTFIFQNGGAGGTAAGTIFSLGGNGSNTGSNNPTSGLLRCFDPAGSATSANIFNPASGSATYDVIYVAPTINQTGTASGITRDILVIPTLTSALGSHRGIETEVSAGGGTGAVYSQYNGGSAPIYCAGDVTIGSSTDNGTQLHVTGSTQLSGSLSLDVAKKLNIAEGTNGIVGHVTLASGTATVSCTGVTANSRIIIWTETSSGTIGATYNYTKSAGTSFTITSLTAALITQTLDTSILDYLIIN